MSKEQLLRQFSGFLNTPPLWQDEQFGIRQFAFPKVDLDQFAPKPIPTNIRLGHQMEHVFKQCIDFEETYEMLLHNLLVKGGNTTVGEIDFIVGDRRTGATLHIELTYKFYLIDTDVTDIELQLTGPNKRDTFVTKMKRIKNEQFKILHSREGIATLGAHALDVRKIEHQACFKAQLFLPYGRDSTREIAPLNANCICGYWLRLSQLGSTEFKTYAFFIPLKAQWVHEPHDNVAWKSHFEILIDINLGLLSEKAPMVWMKKSETDFEKFFVVWW